MLNKIFAASFPCLLILSLCGGFASPEVHATTYYVDANKGHDQNRGTSAALAWRSLAKVQNSTLKPGDEVLLAAASVWTEPLVIKQSGRAKAPIVVRSTGDGPRPRINAGGVSEHAVGIFNAEFVEISGLEVTNDGPPAGPRFGVLIAQENSGVARGIRVHDMYIHDVRGTNARKDNGGIVFRALGPKRPTRFHDLRVERNVIWRVDRSGIAGISDQVDRKRWFPSDGVIIRDNFLEDIGGDGIVPRGTDGALVEHNIVRGAVSRAPGYNVAIWQWSTDNTLVQLNEAAFTRGRLDGQGFDSDFNSRGTTIAHNFSHDNKGGFVLICSPAPKDPDNIGNSGTIVSGNVSRNDGTRIFQLAGRITHVRIENNVIHVGSKQDVKLVVATEWQGWPSDVRFKNNMFAVAGIARYGHEVGRNGPEYLIASGFPYSDGIHFAGNSFLGRHINPPEDKSGVLQASFVTSPADWAVPSFNPANIEEYAAFIARHRSWMMTMLARELGRPVKLLAPRPMTWIHARR